MLFYISWPNMLVASSLFLTGMATIPPWRVLVACMIWGAIDTFTLFFTYAAYKKTDTSVTNGLGRLGMVVSAVLSVVVLGEILNITQYMGYTLIMVTSIILGTNSFKDLKINPAFWLVLIGSSIRACSVIVSKYALNIDLNWVNMTIYTNLFASLAGFSLFLLPNNRREIRAAFPEYLKSFKILLLDEIVCLAGHVCYFYSLGKMTVLAQGAVTSSGPIFTLLIGLILQRLFHVPFNEQSRTGYVIKKMICFTLIGLGIMMTLGVF